jgi:hypothetical protein
MNSNKSFGTRLIVYFVLNVFKDYDLLGYGAMQNCILQAVGDNFLRQSSSMQGVTS